MMHASYIKTSTQINTDIPFFSNWNPKTDISL